MSNDVRAAMDRWREALQKCDPWEADPRTAALRSELAAYRAQPFVPRTDYDRSQEALAVALANVDALTRLYQEATDHRVVRTAERALQSLAALVRLMDSIGGYMAPMEQAEVRIARALLAEVGR